MSCEQRSVQKQPLKYSTVETSLAKNLRTLRKAPKNILQSIDYSEILAKGSSEEPLGLTFSTLGDEKAPKKQESQ